MTNRRKQYNKQFKFKVIVQLIKGEETLQQICSQHEIHASVLQRWKKQFMENGANVFEESAKNKTGHDSTSEKMGPLERKIGQLTMELDFAKKVLERSV